MQKVKFILGLILPILLLSSAVSAMEKEESKPSMILESAAFKNNEQIPSQYTLEGLQTFPPLAWKGAPQKTTSFAIICEDPDATGGTKDHLLAYNIPATVNQIGGEGKTLPSEVRFGKNVRGQLGWAGPRPPKGTGVHHYNFTLYALDTTIELKEFSTKEEIKKAMEGHILGEAKLTGLYQFNEKAQEDKK